MTYTIVDVLTHPCQLQFFRTTIVYMTNDNGDAHSLGQTLKALRELKQKSLKVVADAAEISTAYLQKLERDDVTSPSPHILRRLADALNSDYLDLMRAANYVIPDASSRADSVLANALKSEDLTPEEAQAIAAYLTIFRAQKRGK